MNWRYDQYIFVLQHRLSPQNETRAMNSLIYLIIVLMSPLHMKKTPCTSVFELRIKYLKTYIGIVLRRFFCLFVA